MLCTVAALPGAAAREIRAWDGVATSCVDRRATDAPDAAPLTGRLQELGAQHRARILPGALTLVLASRPPPRLSWSTTFKRGLTVVRGLGIFVFMKNRLVPVKSWKPVFKRRNSATLKKGHSIQVNINPTLQKCEHSPVVVKKTQIVFATTNLDLHCGDYPHPVPRATTKCPTSICVRQTPVPRTMQRGQNTAKF